MRDVIVANGVGVLARVRRIHTIHPILRHHQHVDIKLKSPEGGGRISGEIWVPGSGGKDHHSTLFHMTECTTSDVWFRDVPHFDCRHDSGPDLLLFQRILKSQAVEDSSDHAHVVAGCPIHALARGREPAPDVAATDHDAELDARLHHPTDLLRHFGCHGRIDAKRLIAHQCLTAEFEQDSPVSYTHLTL